MPAAKRKVLVIGGKNLGPGQRTFYRRKSDDGPVTAPFELRIPVEEATNVKELVDKGLAHVEEEDAGSGS